MTQRANLSRGGGGKGEDRREGRYKGSMKESMYYFGHLGCVP